MDFAPFFKIVLRGVMCCVIGGDLSSCFCKSKMAAMMGKRGEASAFKSKMGHYFFSLFSALQLSWIRSTEGSFFKGNNLYIFCGIIVSLNSL